MRLSRGMVLNAETSSANGWECWRPTSGLYLEGEGWRLRVPALLVRLFCWIRRL